MNCSQRWKKQSATVDPPWAPHTAAGEVLSLGDGNEDEHSLLSYCDVQLWQVPAGSLHSPSILFIFLLVLAHIVSLVNSLLCKPSPHFPIFNSLSSIPNLNLLLNTIRSGKNSKFIFFHKISSSDELSYPCKSMTFGFSFSIFAWQCWHRVWPGIKNKSDRSKALSWSSKVITRSPETTSLMLFKWINTLIRSFESFVVLEIRRIMMTANVCTVVKVTSNSRVNSQTDNPPSICVQIFKAR